MKTFINQKLFLSLQPGDSLVCPPDSLDSRFEVATANCNRKSEHPTHFVIEYDKNGNLRDSMYIFHNGIEICYKDHPEANYYSPVLVGDLNGATEIIRHKKQ